MKNRKIILTVGCALALMLAPATVYADTAAQTSPRLGIPVVGSNGEAYANVAISRVSNYVNVRTEPNTSSGIVGKIYNNCAATILKTVDGEGGRLVSDPVRLCQRIHKSRIFYHWSGGGEGGKAVGPYMPPSIRILCGSGRNPTPPAPR